jgi:hypothetical protein
MNYYLLTSGIISLLSCIGHFTMGYNDYIRPVLQSDIDIIPKKIVLCLFHYMSVVMILTTVLLLSFAFNQNLIFTNTADAVKLIVIAYTGFAMAGLLIASKVGIFKLFQWIFWVMIALFSFLGL